MKKGRAKPIRIRKRWVINPKTKVKKSEKIYSRPTEKKKSREIIENITK